MADEMNPTEVQKPRITLDPSKFSISADGQVVVTDPAFVEALRAAATTEDANGHGIGVGVVVEF